MFQRMRYLEIVVSSLAFLLLGQGTWGADEIGRKYALIVGIRQYDPNQLRPVPYAENDAVELAATLTDVGFRRVILLTQVEGARRLKVTDRQVRRLLQGLHARGDAVVIHGLRGRHRASHSALQTHLQSQAGGRLV